MDKAGKDLVPLNFYLSQANVYRLLLVVGSVLLVVLGDLHNYFQPDLVYFEEFRYALGLVMLAAALLSVWVTFFYRHLLTISYICYSLLCLWVLFITARSEFASAYWPGMLVLISISGVVFSHFRAFFYFAVSVVAAGVLSVLLVSPHEAQPWLVIALMPVILFFNGIMIRSRALSNQKHHALATFPEYSPTPMIEIGRSGDIRYANEAAQLVFPDLMELQHLHPLVREVMGYFGTARQHGVVKTIEVKLDDKVYEVLFNFVHASNSLRLYAADISTRKQFQDALLEREERYRIMVQGTNEALIMTDLEEKITFVNKQFCLLFGYKRETVLGESLSELLEDDPQPERIELRKQNRLEGKSEIYEALQRKKGGEKIWTLVSVSPYRDIQTDDIKGSIVAITDISELKKVEEQLKERNEQMDLFLYKATHDLKGPLASVKGILNIALQDCLQPEIRQYIEMALTSTDRLDAALVDLLHVTRLNKSRLKVEQVDLLSLVGEVLQSINHMSERRDVELSTNVRYRDPFATDRNSLSSILQNLIVNAVKYKKSEGEYQHQISVTIEAYREGIQLVVADNGEGIREEIQEKIFQMFYRGNKKSRGTGLGLYIVKQSVDKMGGELRLDSRVGEGTTFTIYLPALELKSDAEEMESVSG